MTLTGTGICAMIAPFYTVWLESTFGWRTAYVGLGLLPLLLAGPLVFLFFRNLDSQDLSEEQQEETQTGRTLAEAARDYRFWILLASIFVAYMAFSGIGPNLFPSLTDDGFTKAQAATVQSVFGGSIIVGRLVVGYLVDRYWAPGVATAALLLPVAGALILSGTPNFAFAAFAAFLIGFAAGAELDLMSFLTARYFGLLHYAQIYSVMYATLAVCSGTAPMLFAQVYDMTQSYDFGFLVASGLFAIGALMVLAMGPYPDAKGRTRPETG